MRNRRRKGQGAQSRRLSAALLGLVGLGALAGPQMPLPARAAETGLSGRARSEQPVRVVIPAQRLADALTAFTRQTGITVWVAPERIAGRRSAAIAGSYPPSQALRLLLGDAPLVIRTVNGTTLGLDPSSRLRPIGRVATVNAPYVTSDPALGKYTRPLLDTPQTIVEVPSSVLQEQNATTLHDALRNVSGISLAAGEGGSQGDSLTIRGFDAKDDMYLDGMRDFGNYYRDPFNLERVEVVMGPASMLAGHGEGGGIVNQVSKLPHLTSFGDASMTGGSAGLARTVLDENVQTGPDSAFRIAAMVQTGGTVDRDVTMDKRIGLAPSYTFGLGTPTRISLSAFSQVDDGIPDYGVPYIDDRPAQVDRSNFYGFANGDRIESNVAAYTASIDHDFSERETLHSQLRFASYGRDFDASNATTPTPQPLPGTPTDFVTVPRTQHRRNGVETFLEDQTYLKGSSGSGNTTQTWIVGFEAARETSHETSFSLSGLPSTNLADPDPYQTMTYTSMTPLSDNHVTADTLAFFGSDSFAFGPHWEFDAGLRFDTFAASNTEYVSRTSAAQDVRKLSPQAALVYKPQRNGTIYLAYDTSFQPSADALSLTSAQLVAPASNVTYELGTKWSLHENRATVNAAIFNSTMNNVHIIEPDGTVLPIGKERSNGFQLQLQGNLSPRWQLTGGYTLLETSVLAYELPTQPNIIGTRIPNAPTGSASLWTTYHLPRFTFGIGGEGLSQRQASIGVDTATGNPILVPGYARVDALFEYRCSPAATIQVNAYNLLDKYYFDEVHPDHVVPGAGRTIAVNLRLRSGR